MHTSRIHSPWFIPSIVTVVILMISGIIMLVWPELRVPVLLGLYEIVCQVISTPLEPVLLYVSGLHPVWLVTLVTTLGCNIGGVYDYWVFQPLLRHEKVRPHYENTRLFVTAMAWFQKKPVLTLIVVAFTPIPFVPFKLLAIADDLPQWKYQLALLIGRAPRYALFALFGYNMPIPDWFLAVLMLALVASYIVSWVRGNNSKKTCQP